MTINDYVNRIPDRVTRDAVRKIVAILVADNVANAAAYAAHVHGGITAGAANSDVPDNTLTVTVSS